MKKKRRVIVIVAAVVTYYVTVTVSLYAFFCSGGGVSDKDFAKNINMNLFVFDKHSLQVLQRFASPHHKTGSMPPK